MKRKGGIKGFIFSAVWTLFIAGVALGGFRIINEQTGGDWWEFFKDKSDKLNECINQGTNCEVVIDTNRPGVTENPDGSITVSLDSIKLEDSLFPGPDGGEAYVGPWARVTAEGALAILEEIPQEEAQDIKYSRAEWKHWDKFDGRSCWTVRQEVLYRQAVTGSHQMVDKSKQATTNYDDACAVVTADWIDPYSGEEMTEAGSIDIDHVIPLAYVARHGGQEWTPEQKEAYANDYNILLATSASENRSKSDKGPSEYMPADDNYGCSYAKHWVIAAQQYGLSITNDDYKVLKSTIKGCEF